MVLLHAKLIYRHEEVCYQITIPKLHRGGFYSTNKFLSIAESMLRLEKGTNDFSSGKI